MYKIEELELKDASDSEQIRTRQIFENLKFKTEKGEILSEHEKDFFCAGVKLSIRNEGNIKDYPCCDNFRFKQVYL